MIAIYSLAFTCLALIVVASVLLKKKVKDERKRDIIMISLAFASLFFHLGMVLAPLVEGRPYVVDGKLDLEYNAFFPVFPCNLLVVLNIILGFTKNKKSKFYVHTSEFIVFFGLLAAFVGLLANDDFFSMGVCFETLRSVLMHSCLIMNIFCYIIWGRVKISGLRNFISVAIGCLFLGIFGLWFSGIVYIVAGKEAMIDINANFLMRDPFGFEWSGFLRFPVIAAIAMPVYFFVGWLIDLKNKKEDRWIARIKRHELY